jgi:hypothetical protein
MLRPSVFRDVLEACSGVDFEALETKSVGFNCVQVFVDLTRLQRVSERAMRAIQVPQERVLFVPRSANRIDLVFGRPKRCVYRLEQAVSPAFDHTGVEKNCRPTVMSSVQLAPFDLCLSRLGDDVVTACGVQVRIQVLGVCQKRQGCTSSRDSEVFFLLVE